MENKEKKENNILLDIFIVIASVLLIPYFAFISMIYDKSIKYYISDLYDHIYDMCKNDNDKDAEKPPTP